jgi:hypothetical protein
MLNGLLEMVFGVLMIAAIPFVISVISIVVSFIKDRN